MIARIVAAGALLGALAACEAGSNPPSVETAMNDPRVKLAIACEGYASAMNVAASAISAGKVNDAVIARIKTIRTDIGPNCEAQDTTDPVAWITAVDTASRELAISMGSN